MDMMNIKRLEERKYQIRFKYRDPLTNRQRVFKRRIDGTLEEARAFRDRAKAQVRRDEFSSEKKTSKTVRHYRSSFAKARKTRRGWKVGRATRERDGYALKDHVLPEIGDWILSEITLADLEEVVDDWIDEINPRTDKPYALSSINNWIKTTRLYLRYACQLEGLDSPAEKLCYLDVQRKKHGTALEPDQVKMFLKRMRTKYPQWYAMHAMGFMLGLRFSSLSALRWDDVDADRKEVRFIQSQYRGTVKRGDKTGKLIVVPLVPALEAVLMWQRRRLFKKQHPGLSTGLVFPSTVPDGVQNGYLSKSAMRNAMARTSEELDKELRKENPLHGFPSITPHDMRRTWETEMNNSKQDRHVIKSIGGQSTDAMVFHYDHVSHKRKAEGLNTLAKNLGLA